MNSLSFNLLTLLVPDADVAIAKAVTVAGGDIFALENVGADLYHVAAALWGLFLPVGLGLLKVDLAVLLHVIDAQLELDHASF